MRGKYFGHTSAKLTSRKFVPEHPMRAGPSNEYTSAGVGSRVNAALPLTYQRKDRFMAEADLTLQRVRELLAYDPGTGHLTWLVPRRGVVREGSIAGSVSARGYRSVKVDGALHSAHRLVWFHVHGRWPANQLDHVNGIRDDNRIANLRECTARENMQNLALRSNNRSGHPGVFWHAARRKWLVLIRVEGQRRYLGYFADPSDAAAAYTTAKAALHAFQPVVR